jgi:hypothetical protein
MDTCSGFTLSVCAVLAAVESLLGAFIVISLVIWLVDFLKK